MARFPREITSEDSRSEVDACVWECAVTDESAEMVGAVAALGRCGSEVERLVVMCNCHRLQFNCASS